MTIQLLNAYNDNPPKVQYLPKFAMTEGRKRYAKMAGSLTLALALIAGVMSHNAFFSNFMSIIFTSLVLHLIIGYFWLTIFYHKMRATNGANVKAQHHIHDYYKKVFLDNGFHIDYEAPGILIDNQQKKIGFTITGAGYDQATKRFIKMLVCDYSDLRSWTASSKDITERVGGELKRHQELFTNNVTHYVTPSYERTVVILNRVRVTINYPDSPLQGFEATSEGDAQQWLARLDSLING